MLKRRMKYAIVTVTILGISACTPPPRTIIIDQTRTRPVSRPAVVAPRPQPVIREEILLGRGSSNSNLGQRVDVPKNRPTVEENVTIEEESHDASATPATPSNEVIERIPFPVEEYRHVKKRGRSTVSGTIYLEN